MLFFPDKLESRLYTRWKSCENLVKGKHDSTSNLNFTMQLTLFVRTIDASLKEVNVIVHI